MVIWLALIVGAYLLGSLPIAYLAAKWSRGIDLTQYGTGQVGGGNLWRLTSWKIGLPVSFFDFTKGMVMVWAAELLGLSLAQQIVVGLAAICGHNWSAFLRFSGGRGIVTTLGVVVVLPLFNEMAPLPTIVFLTILAVGVLMIRRSHIPVLFGVASLPLTSWLSHQPLAVTLALLGIFLVIVTKRLTAPRLATTVPISRGQLILNRLLFDRDIREREAWLYRIPIEGQTQARPRPKKD